MALAARSSLRTSAPRAARNGPAFTNRPVIARRSVVVKAEAVQATPVTDATFEQEVLQAPEGMPVLIDFWAPWCGPCRMIAPFIDQIATTYEGKVKCVKLNTDESPNTASTLGIRSIPTVIIFKGGKKCDTIIGAVPLSTLTAAVEKFL